MIREEAKELLPIIKAFANGIDIQYRKKGNSEWNDVDTDTDVAFNYYDEEYRIKPKPKYRPFKTQEECWDEMLKHQPFGYLRNKGNGNIVHITGLNTVHYGELHIDLSINPHSFYTTDCLFEIYTFIDDGPFGIKE